MSNLWEIYERLISGINPSVKVEKIVCGQIWSAVQNDNGGLGLAMTTAGDSIERVSINYSGMRLIDLAELIKSWNFYEASLGMAAINSYYNTYNRMIENGWKQPDKKYCTFDIDVKDKNIAMIGHMNHEEGLFNEANSFNILEMNPHKGDYPSSACEFILPSCDIVIITGSAFINKTMPRLLELSKNALTIITGPSTPMAKELLNGTCISRLAGFIPENCEELWNLITVGSCKSPYEFGYRFYIDKKWKKDTMKNK
ncbi:MAG: DUF364 domain-containing protein [Eubacteriales bacterium]|nr:DUF364 domain-containing protein [Eubacteriales bacterium]